MIRQPITFDQYREFSWDQLLPTCTALRYRVFKQTARLGIAQAKCGAHGKSTSSTRRVPATCCSGAPTALSPGCVRLRRRTTGPTMLRDHVRRVAGTAAQHPPARSSGKSSRSGASIPIMRPAGEPGRQGESTSCSPSTISGLSRGRHRRHRRAHGAHPAPRPWPLRRLASLGGVRPLARRGGLPGRLGRQSLAGSALQDLRGPRSGLRWPRWRRSTGIQSYAFSAPPPAEEAGTAAGESRSRSTELIHLIIGPAPAPSSRGGEHGKFVAAAALKSNRRFSRRVRLEEYFGVKLFERSSSACTSRGRWRCRAHGPAPCSGRWIAWIPSRA